MKPFVDPKLLAALNGPHELSVFAKFKAGATGSADAVSVVKRVAKKVKQTPRYNFRDLDSTLHVQAGGAFIKELIRQPEILSASMTPGYSSALIQPMNAREVPASAISVPLYPHRRA
jgi:hypothetical protein